MPRPRPLASLLIGSALLLTFGTCVVPPRAALEIPEFPIAHPVQDAGYDVLSYDLDIKLHPTRPRFEGTTTVHFVTTRPVDTITLDASDMEILEVTPATAWHHQGGHLELPLGEVLPAGVVRSVTIRYRAAPLGGMHFALPQEDGLNHIPQLFTQGEDIRARFWFPCHDEPWDRASHTLKVTMPRSWISVAAGRRTARKVLEDGLQVQESWQMDRDMPTYLFTLAAGPFLVLEDEWEGTALWYVGEPEDAELLRASFAETAPVLHFFSDYTGFRYPYAKYAQVAVRDFPFGGMENVSATTVTRNALHPQDEQERQPTWGLVAHEAAHQWFGDTVTCETWAHAWLNEGFASYFTLLYRRERNGEEDFRAAMGDTIDGYLRACQGQKLRPLVKDSFRLPMDIFFDGTIYPGGASRLQLLRGLLGEDVFREGIRLYLEQHAFQPVVSQDLRAAMEQASGRNLHAWFATWVEASGYPTLDIMARESPDGIVLDVTQMQSTAGGVPSFFPLPLDVRWSDGGEWKQERFVMHEDAASFIVPVDDDYDGFLILDPDVLLPAKLIEHDGLDALRLRATHSDRSRDRILALRRLAADYGKDPTVVEFLWQRAQADAVPAVRRKAIASLRQCRGFGLDPLRSYRAWQEEEDQTVQLDWWRALCTVVGKRFEDGEQGGSAKLRTEAMSWMQASLHNADRSEQGRLSALRAWSSALAPAQRRAALEPWLSPEQPAKLRVAAIDALHAWARKDSNVASELRHRVLGMSWKGEPTVVRQAALRLLADGLVLIEPAHPSAFDQSVLDTFDKALLSWNAILRRSAVTLIAPRPELFPTAIAELQRREPDARVRQILRDATEIRFEE